MGNVQSIEEIEKKNQILNEITNLHCCLLDIGDMTGQTDYIDFITEDILEGHDVMKGVDKYGRSFIVVKAHIIYKDLHIVNTFTTFFQRYKDDNIFWVGCGKGTHLMETDTVSGMTIVQLELLRDLLYNRSVKFDNSRDTRVFSADFYKDDIMDIHLGYKIDSLLKQESNCISEVSTNMNQRTSIKDILCDLPEEFQEYIMEEFDDQAEENEDLRIELHTTKRELNKVNAELLLVKSELEIQKQANYDLLQKVSKEKHSDKHVRLAKHSNKQYIPDVRTMSTSRPVLERQTNMVPDICCTPESDPKARLWESIDEEYMENDPTFEFMSMR